MTTTPSLRTAAAPPSLGRTAIAANPAPCMREGRFIAVLGGQPIGSHRLSLKTGKSGAHPESAKFEAIRTVRLPKTTIEVRGQPTVAREWRISDLAQRIGCWLAGGQWLELETLNPKGRHLIYRAE